VVGAAEAVRVGCSAGGSVTVLVAVHVAAEGGTKVVVLVAAGAAAGGVVALVALATVAVPLTAGRDNELMTQNMAPTRTTATTLRPTPSRTLRRVSCSSPSKLIGEYPW